MTSYKMVEVSEVVTSKTILKSSCTPSLLITLEIFQLTNRYQFLGEVMTDILRTKEIIKRATLALGFSRG